MSRFKKVVFVGLYIYMVYFTFNMTLSVDWYGFGVDSSDRVYIGEDEFINVLEEGQVVHTIPVPPHRSYYFTVQADDTILIVTTSYVYVVDYSGNTLSQKDDEGASTFIKLMHLQEIETANGDHYRCRSFLGRRFIEDENGEVVFKVPFIEYCADIVNALPFVLIGTVIFLSEWEKRKKENNKPPENSDPNNPWTAWNI